MAASHSALLQAIQRGKQLKKTETKDRSAPVCAGAVIGDASKGEAQQHASCGANGTTDHHKAQPSSSTDDQTLDMRTLKYQLSAMFGGQPASIDRSPARHSAEDSKSHSSTPTQPHAVSQPGCEERSTRAVPVANTTDLVLGPASQSTTPLPQGASTGMRTAQLALVPPSSHPPVLTPPPHIPSAQAQTSHSQHACLPPLGYSAATAPAAPVLLSCAPSLDAASRGVRVSVSRSGLASSGHEQQERLRALSHSQHLPSPRASAGAQGAVGASASPCTNDARRSSSETISESEAHDKKSAKETARMQERQRAICDTMHMLRNVPFIACTVPDAAAVGVGGSCHVVYRLRLSLSRQNDAAAAFHIAHRYSEFRALHEGLARRWGKQMTLPRLPPKRIAIRALSEAQVEERRAELEEYMQQLLLRINWTAEPQLRAFLQVDAWLRERRPVTATGDAEAS